MSEKTHSPLSGWLTGVKEFRASCDRSMPTRETGPVVCMGQQESAREPLTNEQTPACTHQACGTVFRIPKFALDKAAIHQDGVLSLSSLQRCKDVVSELAVARFRAKFDRVLVIQLARHIHLPPRVLGDRGRTAGGAKRQRDGLGSGDRRQDALDLGGQPNGRLVQFLVELVDQVDFPLQPLDLPHAEEECKDGHDADEQEVRPGPEFVAGRLRSAASRRSGCMSDDGKARLARQLWSDSICPDQLCMALSSQRGLEARRTCDRSGEAVHHDDEGVVALTRGDERRMVLAADLSIWAILSSRLRSCGRQSRRMEASRSLSTPAAPARRHRNCSSQ